MKNDLKQLLLSLKLGDGCYLTNNGKSYCVSTNSINIDYLVYKYNSFHCHDIETSTITKGTSGYKRDRIIPRFSTHVDARISEVGIMTRKECIKKLDLKGLILLYLDDGSYHKHRKTMHIYCNSFSLDEVKVLQDKIYELFPVKYPNLLWDRKKDGRKYPYIYIPVDTAKEMCFYVKKFLEENNIKSLFYKAGLPSQTIESTTTCRK